MSTCMSVAGSLVVTGWSWGMHLTSIATLWCGEERLKP